MSIMKHIKEKLSREKASLIKPIISDEEIYEAECYRKQSEFLAEVLKLTESLRDCFGQVIFAEIDWFKAASGINSHFNGDIRFVQTDGGLKVNFRDEATFFSFSVDPSTDEYICKMPMIFFPLIVSQRDEFLRCIFENVDQKHDSAAEFGKRSAAVPTSRLPSISIPIPSRISIMKSREPMFDADSIKLVYKDKFKYDMI